MSSDVAIATPSTAAEALAHAAQTWPDRAALMQPDGTVTHTWSGLLADAEALAAALAAAGIGRGHALAIASPTTPDAVVWIQAAALAGAAVVPLNLQFTQRENSEYLERIGRDFEITYMSAEPFKPAFPDDDRRRLAVDESSADDRWVLLPDAPGGGPQRDGPTPEDPVWVIATSGSTGFPKPTVIPHRASVHIARAMIAMLGQGEVDRVLGFMPIFHAGGLSACTTTLSLSGASIVLMPTFDPAACVKAMEDHQVTVMTAFDTLFQKLAALPEFSVDKAASLRAVCLAGSKKYFDELERWGVERICQFYGMTEGVMVTSTAGVNDREKLKWTNGRPVEDVEVRIVDPETGAVLGDGEVGEICFRGPNLFLGYAGIPEVTAEFMDDDGFFHSGDRGYTEDGFLHFQGRYKNVVKTGGENVSQLEVEDFLGDAFPEIEAVAVVGAPDDYYGEIVCAFVEFKPGASLALEELRERCKGQLAGFKIPRRLDVVEPGGWPLLGSGKLDKNALREQVAAGS